MITLSLECSCGNQAKFTSSRQETVDGVAQAFRDFHNGDGHEVTPAPESTEDPSP